MSGETKSFGLRIPPTARGCDPGHVISLKKNLIGGLDTALPYQGLASVPARCLYHGLFVGAALCACPVPLSRAVCRGRPLCLPVPFTRDLHYTGADTEVRLCAGLQYGEPGDRRGPPNTKARTCRPTGRGGPPRPPEKHNMQILMWGQASVPAVPFTRDFIIQVQTRRFVFALACSMRNRATAEGRPYAAPAARSLGVGADLYAGPLTIL